MDTYSKLVFTIIAGALVIIAWNTTLKPELAVAHLGGGPTFGEWLSAVQDKDNPSNPMDVVRRAPLVAVCDAAKCFGWSR